MATEDPIDLCVIICTYNRARELQSCLESLTRQSICTDQFSVLVVDNNSSDKTAQIAQNFGSHLPHLRYVFESKQGLSYARNRGLQEADSNWVAFLDDDAMARSDWVERIFNMIGNHPFDAFGGIYLPWYRDGKASWYLDSYATDRTWMPYDEISELKERCFSGGNAVFRREAALAAGGFPTELGMQGDQLGYGEENTLQYALRRMGYRTGIDPEMNIDHLVPLHKQTLTFFLQRRCTEGKIHLWQGRKDPNWREIASLFVTFALFDARNLGRGIWRLLTGKYRVQNLYIDTVPEWCFQWQVLLSLFRPRPKVR